MVSSPSSMTASWGLPILRESPKNTELTTCKILAVMPMSFEIISPTFWIDGSGDWDIGAYLKVREVPWFSPMSHTGSRFANEKSPTGMLHAVRESLRTGGCPIAYQDVQVGISQFPARHVGLGPRLFERIGFGEVECINLGRSFEEVARQEPHHSLMSTPIVPEIDNHGATVRKEIHGS